MFRIPLLQRIVFKELCIVALLMLVLMSFLLILLQFQRMGSVFSGIQVSFIDISLLLILLMPYLLTFIFPITVLISVFVVFFRMLSDNEITALRSSGVPIRSLLPAVMLFGAILSSISLYLFFYAVPKGTQNFEKALHALAIKRIAITITPNVFYRAIPNTVIYAKRVEAQNMEDVFIETVEPDGNLISIVAQKGKIVIEKARDRIRIVLDAGYIYSNDADTFIASNFTHYTMDVPLDAILDVTPPRSSLGFDALDYSDIQKQMMLYKKKGATLEEKKTLQLLRIEEQKRFSFPIACFILALFAVPIATSKELGRNTMLCILLIAFIVYYTASLLCINLATSGVIPVWFIWLPNIVFLLASIRGIVLVSEEKGGLFIVRSAILMRGTVTKKRG